MLQFGLDFAIEIAQIRIQAILKTASEAWQTQNGILAKVIVLAKYTKAAKANQAEVTTIQAEVTAIQAEVTAIQAEVTAIQAVVEVSQVEIIAISEM